MDKYNVIFRMKGGQSRNGAVYDAINEMDAIEQWKKSINGKNGMNEIIEVY